MVRVFTNGLGDRGSISSRVITKTQKMLLDTSLLRTQHYKVLFKGKVEQSVKGVIPSSTPQCSSYRKGSLQVTLDYCRQFYFFVYSQLNVKTVLFEMIQLSISSQFQCQKTVPFQTIQLGISKQFQCKKTVYFK